MTDKLNDKIEKASEAIGDAANATVDAAAEAARKAREEAERLAKKGRELAEQEAQKLKESTQAALDKSLTAINKKDNEKSGGFLSDNKGLIGGGIIALIALMSGGEGTGMMPILFALAAGIGGFAIDRENGKGIIGSLFGKSKEVPAPTQNVQLSIGDTNLTAVNQQQTTSPAQDKPAPISTRTAQTTNADITLSDLGEFKSPRHFSAIVPEKSNQVG